MTDLREAAQMALDALEELKAIMPAFPKDGKCIVGYKERYDAAQFQSSKSIDVLRARLAQPEQEPVEWQGLTDEELLDIADMAYANDLELLQTLQAKLKEKNNG